MLLEDVIAKRQSVRNFLDKNVSEDVIDTTYAF